MARKQEDREGRWEPVAGSSSPDIGGKIEWERWDTHDEIDALVSRVDAPAGSVVQVLRGDRVLLEGMLERKRSLFGGGHTRARLSKRTDEGHEVPELMVGDELFLRVGSERLAKAVIELD